MARYRFWINDKDSKGQPLDREILETAEEIASTLTCYRQHEIDCESTSNDLLQEAAEAASEAACRIQIDRPAGYLRLIYKRIVDKFLERQQKVVLVDDEFLEDLANAGRPSSFENGIHNRLLMEQLTNWMDPETQQIFGWRLEGYSEAEIAERLGTTPNAVSVRYTRGVRKAKRNAFRGGWSSKAR